MLHVSWTVPLQVHRPRKKTKVEEERAVTENVIKKAELAETLVYPAWALKETKCVLPLQVCAHDRICDNRLFIVLEGGNCYISHIFCSFLFYKFYLYMLLSLWQIYNGKFGDQAVTFEAKSQFRRRIPRG